MSNNKLKKHSFLYPDNIKFVNNQINLPVNYEEIIESMKKIYGVYKQPFVLRFLSALITLLIVTILIIFVISTLIGAIDNISEDIFNFSDLLVLMSVLIFTVPTIIFFLRLASNLILHRTKQVEKGVNELVSHGIILVTSEMYPRNFSPRDTIVQYKFKNPDGKTVVGKYYFKGWDADVPKQTRVLYVDKSVHTLL